MARISVLLSGTVRMWSHGRGELMNAGDTIINPPGALPRVAERLTRTSESLTVYLAPALCQGLADRAGGPALAEWQVHVVSDAPLVEAVRKLSDAVDGGAGAEEALRELVERACATLRGDGVRTMPAGPLRAEIARVRSLLEERFDQPIALDELAGEARLSKFHLLRLFREEIGTTPHSYQLHLRISRAREMLDAGQPPAEVALACGFADQPHFTRSFKRIVGYTPAAFKRLA